MTDPAGFKWDGDPITASALSDPIADIHARLEQLVLPVTSIVMSRHQYENVQIGFMGWHHVRRRAGGVGSDMSPGLGALPYRVAATLHGLRRLSYRRDQGGLRRMLEIACRHEPNAEALVARAVAALEHWRIPV